jgi:hypothetical protein
MARTSLEDFLITQGYRHIRRLPTGELAAVMDMLFTTGLFVGLDAVGYRTRFCFEKAREAEASLAEWDGKGFPPGWWIKQKPEETPNPLRADA